MATIALYFGLISLPALRQHETQQWSAARQQQQQHISIIKKHNCITKQSLVDSVADGRPLRIKFRKQQPFL